MKGVFKGIITFKEVFDRDTVYEEYRSGAFVHHVGGGMTSQRSYVTFHISLIMCTAQKSPNLAYLIYNHTVSLLYGTNCPHHLWRHIKTLELVYLFYMAECEYVTRNTIHHYYMTNSHVSQVYN